MNGEMSRIDYELDFPYEVKKRYRNMRKEDYADMLYFYLIECRTDQDAGSYDKAFCELIQKQYLEVLNGVY